jgi:hypothetical protein
VVRRLIVVRIPPRCSVVGDRSLLPPTSCSTPDSSFQFIASSIQFSFLFLPGLLYAIVTMFYQGTLQEGIAFAVSQSKAVVCFVRGTFVNLC